MLICKDGLNYQLFGAGSDHLRDELVLRQSISYTSCVSSAWRHPVAHKVLEAMMGGGKREYRSLLIKFCVI